MLPLCYNTAYQKGVIGSMIAKLRDIRKQRGMTQEQLAKATGIHRVTIARYETQKIDPTTECAKKLAAALGVTVDELIGKPGQ